MGYAIKTKRSGESRVIAVVAVVLLAAAAAASVMIFRQVNDYLPPPSTLPTTLIAPKPFIPPTTIPAIKEILDKASTTNPGENANPPGNTVSTQPTTTTAAVAATIPAGTTQRITLLHIADLHGRLEPWSEGGKSCGGVARLATAIESIRNEKSAGEILLLDAGDDLSRGDNLTDKTSGAAVIELLNHLKINAWTPGNGDFYLGVGVLQKRISEFKGDTLAANVKIRSDNSPLAKNYVVYQMGKVNVAVVGLCFIRTVLPSAWGLEVSDPINTLSQLMPELKKQADAIVVLSHLGQEMDQKIVETVDGVDIVIGGHSHVAFLKEEKRFTSPSGRRILICHTGEHLKFFGRAELNLRFDGEKWNVISSSEKLIRLENDVKLDPVVTAMIAKMSREAESQPAFGEQPEQDAWK